jgi:hypothetical protein
MKEFQVFGPCKVSPADTRLGNPTLQEVYCHKVNPELLNERKLPERRWKLVGVSKRVQGRPNRSSAAFARLINGSL